MSRALGRRAAAPPSARTAAPLVALVLSVAVGLSACSTSPGAEAGGHNPGASSPSASTSTTLAGTVPLTERLRWHSCHKDFRCSTLVVPASYSDKSEGTFDIAVVEDPAASGAANAPDIVMNPGGPGAGGIQFLTSAAGGFSGLRAHFNLVSFDPRGVGASSAVACGSASDLTAFLALDPSPTTPSEVSGVVSGVKAFVAACLGDTPRRLLDNVSTADTARDMDRLRAALGEKKLDYLGFSYGTYLGTLYAEAFPARVGRLVLDGAIDPALSVTQSLTEQAAGFELDLRDFFSWCDKNSTCNGEVSGNAAAAFEGVMRDLRSGTTLTAHMNPSYGGTQQIDYGIALLGAISALYSRNTWQYLGEAIAGAKNGEGAYFLALADSYAGIGPNGEFSNELAANAAINCVDNPYRSSISGIEALSKAMAAVSPNFGPAEAWGDLVCDFWPVVSRRRPGPAHLVRALPILVVGSTHDPATPYSWAKALSSQLAGSVLLTRTGDGHTGYLASQCVRKWVNGFFATGGLPSRGTVCAS